MAKHPIHELLVAQEAAIDKLFKALVTGIAADLLAGPTLPTAPERTRVVRARVDALFGSSPRTALESPIGKLILAYAERARLYAIRNMVADHRAVVGREAHAAAVSAAIREATILKQAFDYLDVALADAERPLTGNPGPPMVLVPMPDGTTQQADRIVRAAIKSFSQPVIDDAVIRRLADQAMRNPALIASYIILERLPKVLNDTARWIVDEMRLADRIWNAGQDVRAQIEARLNTADRRKWPPARAKEALDRYLTARYEPKTTRSGRIAPGADPGMITANGRGRGSFPARRLGRHEATRAYGDTVKQIAASSEITPAIRWMTNPIHPRADVCDDHADLSSPGLPPGVYLPQDLPFYPAHINCLCIIEPVDLQGNRPR